MVARLTRKLKRYKVIAVDFDGCLCADCYPDIGVANLPLITGLLKAQQAGAKLILWTCRSGSNLTAAIRWCKMYGLQFDAVNDNVPGNVKRYGNNCRKVNADLYLDDRAMRVVW